MSKDTSNIDYGNMRARKRTSALEYVRARAINRAKGRYNNFHQSYIDYCDQWWIQKIRTGCISPISPPPSQTSPICIRLNPAPAPPTPVIDDLCDFGAQGGSGIDNYDSVMSEIDDCADENKQPDLELIRSESKTSMTAFIIFWMNVLHIMGCLHFLVILRRNNWYVHLCMAESVWM